jgi:hypothetical protein
MTMLKDNCKVPHGEGHVLSLVYDMSIITSKSPKLKGLQEGWYSSDALQQLPGNCGK